MNLQRSILHEFDYVLIFPYGSLPNKTKRKTLVLDWTYFDSVAGFDQVWNLFPLTWNIRSWQRSERWTLWTNWRSFAIQKSSLLVLQKSLRRRKKNPKKPEPKKEERKKNEIVIEIANFFRIHCPKMRPYFYRRSVEEDDVVCVICWIFTVSLFRSDYVLA